MYVIRDTKEVDAMLRALESDFKTMRWSPFMKAELRNLENVHKQYFDSFRGPDGKPWKKNAPSTIAQKGHSRQLHGNIGTIGRPASKGAKRFFKRYGKARIGSFPLRQSLTLPSSEFGIRYDIDEWPKAMIVFGTDAPYHGYNQEGTKRIPARPHLGITAPYFNQLAKRANKYALSRIIRIKRAA